MFISLSLTTKTVEGRAPPPAVAEPGWGTPWGGNIGKGGGTSAAKVTGMPIAVRTAAASWEISGGSDDSIKNDFINVPETLYYRTC